MSKKHFFFLKKYFPEIILSFFAIWLSVFLMVSTFSYKNGSMLIASHAWSDFASHIPLIRSFSFGANFPPEYPLFPGFPIKYHFLFYLLAGALERAGIRIDYALNIPSILGFVALLVAIYLFSYVLLKSRLVSILSVIFFVFNGSFAFLNFFIKHPLSVHTLSDIITNRAFPAFGPYDNSIISAFWNLNIYTNQRHLAPAYAISLFSILFFLLPVFLKKKFPLWYSGIVGFLLGVTFLLNIAAFAMTVVVLGSMLILFPKLRKSLLVTAAVAGAIAFPQYHYFQSSAGGFKISFHPGYLIADHVTIMSFIGYWIANFGLHILLIPVGFFAAPKNAKKIFLAFGALFIVGNLFQFSPEMAANHKFFNYFLVVGAMFSAFALYKIFQKTTLHKIIVGVLIFFCVLSGIIDFFPIYNDYQVTLPDYPVNPDIRWVKNHTNPNAVFLNTSYLYDTASVAGRKIFLGWPYFSWSQGYNTTTRSTEQIAMVSATDKKALCSELSNNVISYIELTVPSDPNIGSISPLISSLKPLYTNATHTYSLYSVKQNCK